MRHHRFYSLCAGAILATAVVACGDDNGTGVAPRPSLAGVRFINALADTFDVDIRPQDQVEWSASANRLAFRSATEYQPTQAGARHFRMFPQPGPDAADPNVVSQVLLDTTVTFEANANYTVLVTGSARANTERFVVIKDEVPAVPAGSIALRAINASSGTVSLYITDSLTHALPATPLFADVSSLGVSAYATRAAGATAARASETGDATISASVAGPKAPPPPSTSPPSTVFPSAGVDAAGSAFSVIYFPSSVVGSKAPQSTAFLAPAVVFFVDKHPPRS